jgi:FAD/FMN-containing dehydrogenase
VGLGGSFSLDGSNSPLSSFHGLGADNVLEWHVVTANGTRTRAAPDETADFFWTLSGGGGGAYAVVVAITARMHRDDNAPTAGALLSVNMTALASSSTTSS